MSAYLYFSRAFYPIDPCASLTQEFPPIFSTTFQGDLDSKVRPIKDVTHDFVTLSNAALGCWQQK